MEFFILALIERAKLRSIYSFQQRAGLQPGGIRPALVWLELRGLIKRAEFAARNRKDFFLTEDGSLFLLGAWKECLRDHTDTESVLRAACVGLLMGEVDSAVAYLHHLANLRRLTAQEKTREAKTLEPTLKDPLSAYAWVRVMNEAQRRGAESEAFTQFAQYLHNNKGTLCLNATATATLI
jgi:hypothetical protein